MSKSCMQLHNTNLNKALVANLFSDNHAIGYVEAQEKLILNM